MEVKQQESLLKFNKPFDLSNESSKCSLAVTSQNQDVEQISYCKYCNKELVIGKGMRHKSYCNCKCSQKYRYYSNRDEILRKKKEYDNENKELVREQYREWYVRNKEKKIIQKKAYYNLNKKRYKEYNKKYREKLLEVLKGYDLLRGERGIYYDIEKNPYKLWRKNYCEMCGWDIDTRILDVHHIDGLLKHTDKDNKDNVLTLCRNCHMLIHKFSIQDLIMLNERLKCKKISITKKRCNNCENEFISSSQQKKSCSKKCYMENRRKDPNFIKEITITNKEYYKKHRESISQKCKEYIQRPEVKEHKKEYNKQYHIRNKEKLDKYQKQYNQDNKEHIREYQKRYKKLKQIKEEQEKDET